MSKFLPIVMCGGLLTAATWCGAATIDFESLPAGVPATYLSVGNIMILNPIPLGDTVIWDSGESLTELSGHALLGTPEYYEQTIEYDIFFAIPVTNISFTFGSLGQLGPYHDTALIDAHDINDEYVSRSAQGTVDLPDPLGRAGTATLPHDQPIVRMHIQLQSVAGAAMFLDNLSFDPVDAAAPPVTWDIATEVLIEQAPITLTLLAADVDEAPQAMTYVVTALPSHGTLVDVGIGAAIDSGDLPYTLAGNGRTVRYAPDAGFENVDTFTYLADDGGIAPDGGPSAESTVTLDVNYLPPTLVTDAIPNGRANAAYAPFQFTSQDGHPDKTWTLIVDEPYAVDELGTSLYDDALGTSTGITSVSTPVSLPFTFPFYGKLFNEVRVTPNGFLYLGDSDFNSPVNWQYDFDALSMIAPMWTDLTVNPAFGDAILRADGIDEGVAFTAFRWKCRSFVPSSPPGTEPPVNVACTLWEDGRIRFDYGNGNGGYVWEPIIGLSAGDGERFQTIWDGHTSFSFAQSVQWNPPGPPAGMQIGADGLFEGTPTQAGTYSLLVRVTGDDGQSDVRILPWIVEEGCYADSTGDNEVGVDDFFALLQHWGDCPAAPDPCPWDITGDGDAPDGAVGVSDFFALLQHWGPCD
jgi:hypothetical protein